VIHNSANMHETNEQKVKLDMTGYANDDSTSPEMMHKSAFSILSKWGCTDTQIKSVLSSPDCLLNNDQNESHGAVFTKDQLERIEHVFNIDGYLKIVFDNPVNIYGFMGMLNENSPFLGKSPIELICSDEADGLRRAHDHIKHLCYAP
jgi:hypothetical protein